MEKPVIIFGASGLGKSALEIFQSNNVVVYGFLDENKELHNTEIGNVPVLGDPEDHGFLKLIGQKCEAFVANDDNTIRRKQVDYLMKTRKVMPTNAVHQLAYVSETAVIGHGNFIGPRAILNSYAEIGQHCIINSGVILEQDVKCGDLVQIGAGSILNSGVEVGKNAFIGSGVTIVSGVKIGKNARIGAGSLVVSDVPDNTTVFGNPAVKVEDK
jgi:sugar O-acyltransferase (sialic acid O-acetyltransferase NeuD family)